MYNLIDLGKNEFHIHFLSFMFTKKVSSKPRIFLIALSNAHVKIGHIFHRSREC